MLYSTYCEFSISVQVEIVIAFYLWVCVISLHQLLGSDQWLAENNMEMRPKFTSKYNSVPTSD